MESLPWDGQETTNIDSIRKIEISISSACILALTRQIGSLFAALPMNS
jgi:hypothetical protein